MNLSLLIILPLLTALALIPFKDYRTVRMISFAGSLIQLILTIVLLFAFLKQRNSGDASPFIFEYDHAWYPSLNIHYHVGIDGISLSMILLTSFVVFAGNLVSWKMEKMSREFFFLLHLLSLGAYGFFISLDLFALFFFLELAVIPKFLLIGIWGSGRKEYSAMKLVLMLMTGSALVFVSLAGIYFNSNVNGHASFDLTQIATLHLPIEVQKLFFPFAFVGFGIFSALFPFHTWVPDGHSSAPTAGSMFLAGISMKLGGYGCLRVAAFLMPDAAHYYSPIIIILAAIAILYGAFATMMQTDLKYINAYSSVSHCGFVLLGIGILTPAAINGAVLQMVSHGLMTALFFAVIGMIYERTHTRKVAEMGGLLKAMPFISTSFILAGLCSLGLPGLSGFVAEVTIFIGGFQRTETIYRIVTIVACASIVVTAVYILRATATTLMGGAVRQPGLSLNDAKWYERTASLVLLAGILIIGIAPFWITEIIHPGTEIIMDKIGSAMMKISLNMNQ
jgi:NADH-quinone oxidoreductase subunit M